MVLVFQVGKFLFGLDAQCVRSIERLRAIAPAPALPPHFAGVCTLRGDVVPVVDLAQLFHTAHAQTYTCLVHVAHAGIEVAFLADAVSSTRNSAAAQQRPEGEERFDAYVTARFPDRCAILDIDLILDALVCAADDT